MLWGPLTLAGLEKLNPEYMYKNKDKDKTKGPFKSVDEMIETFRENETKWDRFMQATWWPFYRFCADFKWKYIRGIKRFCQRGYRGYANADTWSFDGYLADVIINGLSYFRDNLHGFPADFKDEKEWIAVIDKIIYTFKLEREVIDNDVVIPKNLKEYLKYKKTFDGTCIKVLTAVEHKKYEEGWKLFKKYFRGLWD